jgi:hypothetical protein
LFGEGPAAASGNGVAAAAEVAPGPGESSGLGESSGTGESPAGHTPDADARAADAQTADATAADASTADASAADSGAGDSTGESEADSAAGSPAGPRAQLSGHLAAGRSVSDLAAETAEVGPPGPPAGEPVRANGVYRPNAGPEGEPAGRASRPSLADAATVQVPAIGDQEEHPDEHAGGNGHQPALPPPWQRVPAGTPVSSLETAGPARSAGAAPARPAANLPNRPNSPGGGSSAETGGLSGARTVSMDPPTSKMRLTPPAPSSGVGGGGAEPEHGGADTGTVGGFPMTWPRNRRPRQAALQLKRLDPWSVLKVALVLAVVLYLVWLVAVGVLYGVLDGIGVWERLNGQYADLVAEQSGDQLISAGRVFGVAAVIGAVNSLLFAVALSVGAFVYNVSADLVGGVEVTLSERD